MNYANFRVRISLGKNKDGGQVNNKESFILCKASKQFLILGYVLQIAMKETSERMTTWWPILLTSPQVIYVQD